MRFARFPSQRFAPIAFAVVLLMLAVAVTFDWKRTNYGRTPFFNSVGLVVEEMAVAAVFNAWHSFGDLAAFAAPEKAQAEQTDARAIPVLTYHRIALTKEGGQLTLMRFMDQMETLYRAGWRTITLDQYRQYMRGELALPERTFLITFDDGAQQSYYPTDPIFRTLNYHAAEYVIVAGSETPESTYYLSPEQIDSMLATGRWEIGSHSFDAHHTYPTDANGGIGIFYTDKLWLPAEGRLETDDEFLKRVHDDLVNSRKALEARYGVTVDTFAIPFGGETGHQAADNYPAGNDVTLSEASKLYDFVWLQTNRKDFTYNYPAYASTISKRIHVDYDWNGNALKTFMEGGLPKNLPYSDNFAADSGWRSSWGGVQPIGSLELTADPGDTSAGSVLDGSLLWNTYQAEATVNWEQGYALIMGAVHDALTYRSCSFSPGEVEIHETNNGTTTTLVKRAVPIVEYGQGVKLGIDVKENSISCLYNNVLLLSTQTANNQGGVGIQTWAREPGTAHLVITNFLANPL